MKKPKKWILRPDSCQNHGGLLFGYPILDGGGIDALMDK